MDIINGLFTNVQALADYYDFECNDAGFSFTFTHSDKELGLLTACVKSAEEAFSFLIDGVYVDFSSIEKPKSVIKEPVIVEVNRQYLTKKGICLYRDWNDYLGYKNHYLKPDDRFIIVESGVVYPTPEAKGKLKNYLNACEVMALLLDTADHVTYQGEHVVSEVVFLHKNKLEIPIAYSEQALETPLDGITLMLSSFNEDTSHREQKKSILKEVLHGFVSNVPINERFEYLLKQFGELSKRFMENYQLFVSEFSFDEVRKEYEESKREYLVKLNEVFSSVYTKMLGIPISLAVGSLRIGRFSDKVDFWGNVLLLTAVLIYVVMMRMLIANQKHSLSAIKSEYDSQMTRLKHQFSDQYNAIEEIKSELDKRFRFHKHCLALFQVVAYVLIVVVGFSYFILPWDVVAQDMNHWLGFFFYLKDTAFSAEFLTGVDG